MRVRSQVRLALMALVVAGLAYVVVVIVGLPEKDAWSSPVDLSIQAGDPSAVQVGVDARGNAIAVWQDKDSFVRAALRPAGRPWQPPTTISDERDEAMGPQIAVGSDGTAVAVWQRFVSGDHIVQSATRPPGGEWQTPVDLSGGGTGGVSAGATDRHLAGASRPMAPQVAVDQDGSAVVVWEHYRDDRSVVQAAVRPADGAWQAPVDLDDTSVVGPDEYAAPHAALDPDGDAIVVWTRATKPGEPAVRSATRRAGGRWKTPVTISAAGEHAAGARVDVDARGNATAVWTSSSVVRSAHRTAGGRWGAPVDISARGARASEAQVAVDARGDTVAVWDSSRGDRGIVQATTRPAAGRWQTPIDISASDRGAYAGTGSLAVGAGGGAVVAWVVPDRDENDDDDQTPDLIVYAALRRGGGDWGDPVKLNDPNDFPPDPDVAVDPKGNTLAIWKGPRGIVQAAAHDPRDS